jgi:peptidoglycan/xylan/chitin deacetylase (PgdA/CDA1 family)
MLSKIKWFIEELILVSPAIFNQPLLFNRTFFRRKVAILMYHGVVRTPLDVPDWCFLSERDFSRQMQYLRRNFKVVSLAEAAVNLRENRINEPTAVITFDDGYQNVYDVAYPILSRFGLPATVFLNTAFINTANTIWSCVLNKAISETTLQTFVWNGQVYNLNSTASKARTSEKLQSALKQFPHQELLEKLAEIREALDIHTPTEVSGDSHFRMLDSQSIAEMVDSGLIEFGAHTANHTILTCVDKEFAQQEIASSIEDTQKLTDKPCRLFAYPNGRAQDYNEAVIQLLDSAGIEAAVTTREGPNTVSTPPLELRRYCIGAGDSLLRFILQLHHQPPDL